jgi:hypothetical protein
MTACGAKRTLDEGGLADLGMSNLSFYLTLYLLRQWRVRGCELLEYCGGSTSAATPSNLDGAARAETYQDQILRGPRAKGFRAWYRLSEPFGSLPASNFTAARFLSDSGDWSWPRKSVASKTMPGACSAVPEHEAIMPLNLPVSFTSTSSMPKTVGGPAAYLLVVSAAVIRWSSTWYEPL